MNFTLDISGSFVIYNLAPRHISDQPKTFCTMVTTDMLSPGNRFPQIDYGKRQHTKSVSINFLNFIQSCMFPFKSVVPKAVTVMN